ncbi:hypothetical protein DRO44_03770 [Candidatus Bathyarchaeota archaeon]|nr:MAG: hypothetical protein DRO44_03770 [Candidatus Bathyarchaeota archaeon]
MSYPTHKQCANFKNGFCTVYKVAVNPNDPACPNFVPRTATQASKYPTVRKYDMRTQTPSTVPRQNYYPHPFPHQIYRYRTVGYGYPCYIVPQLLDEELAMLEAYKRELQAKIETLNVRIRQLRRQLSVASR